MKKQIHFAQEIGQWFRFDSLQRAVLQALVILGALCLGAQMFEGFDEKAAGSSGRVKDRFPEPGIYHRHDELYERPRSVELTRVTGGVAHFAQHGLIEMAEGMNLVFRGEMNSVNAVNNIAQQVTVHHAVDGALKDPGDDIAPVAISALERPQVGKEPCPALSVGTNRLILIDERDQFRASDPFRPSCPVTPAIGRLNARAVAPPG